MWPSCSQKHYYHLITLFHWNILLVEKSVYWFGLRSFGTFRDFRTLCNYSNSLKIYWSSQSISKAIKNFRYSSIKFLFWWCVSWFWMYLITSGTWLFSIRKSAITFLPRKRILTEILRFNPFAAFSFYVLNQRRNRLMRTNTNQNMNVIRHAINLKHFMVDFFEKYLWYICVIFLSKWVESKLPDILPRIQIGHEFVCRY